MEKYLATGCLLLLLTYACAPSTSEDTTDRLTPKKIQRAVLKPLKVPVALHDQGVPSVLKEHLFSEFFNGRAEFYVVNSPDKYLYGKKVDKMVLYYLDHYLARSKYELKQDITEDLIRQHGAFRIVGLDDKNREVVKELRQSHGQRTFQILHHELDNVQLSWRQAERHMLWTIRRQEGQARYTFIEEIPQYKRVFKRVEYGR